MVPLVDEQVVEQSLVDEVCQTLDRLVPATGQVTVAWSGGLDSTALVTLARLWGQRRQRVVTALHVNHGLSANASQWVSHCRQLARQWQLPLTVVTTPVVRQPRQSLEAVARDARYRAFADHVAAGVLLLAHHQQDQAETLLLRLARGSGPQGLAAMAEQRPLRADLMLLRPLLAVSRAALERWVAANGYPYVEDESNIDLRFSRNAIRHQLLPLWRQLTPALDQQLVRTAAHCGELTALAAEIAQADRQQAAVGDDRLDLRVVVVLSPARRHNLLRSWLAEWGLVPQTAQLQQLWQQLAEARGDSNPQLQLGGLVLRRYRHHLYRCRPSALPLPTTVDWPSALSQPLVLADGRRLRLVAGGQLRSPLADERVWLAFDLAGSTQAHPSSRARGRSLTKLWQEYGIPPWQRPQVPLLFYNQQLVAAVGLWLERDALVAHGGVEVKLDPAS